MNNVYARLKELKIELPSSPIPAGNYLTGVSASGLIYVAGQTAWQDTGTLFNPGKVGRDITMEQAYQSARLATIRLIRELNDIIDLNKIRILKVNGYVNSAPDFLRHSDVINGASDLLVAVFGDRGKHARTAVGVSSLPGNASVEVELVALQIEQDNVRGQLAE